MDVDEKPPWMGSRRVYEPHTSTPPYRL